MYAKSLKLAVLGFVIALFAAVPALADHHKAKIMTKDGIGSYIADAKGMTLYYFTKDTPGVSACAGDCLQKWPAYFADKVEPQAGLNAADFATIKRADGASQTTFRGYPLYYFFKDAAPGDTAGQGVNSVWYVIDPAKFPAK
jgi:predicted lipoprotein with Yx(FWY)xxD motif